MDERELVENKNKPWVSTYDYQRRPDTSERLKKVIPKDRLTVKKGKFFTTETNQKTIVNAAIPVDNKPKKKFQAKNG